MFTGGGEGSRWSPVFLQLHFGFPQGLQVGRTLEEPWSLCDGRREPEATRDPLGSHDGSMFPRTTQSSTKAGVVRASSH